MSEKLTNRPEHNEKPSEAELLLPTPEQAEPLRKGEKDPQKALQEARAEIERAGKAETHASALEHLKDAEKPSRPAVHSYVNRELKKLTLGRELTHIRRRLSPPARTFSKVIHQPIVRGISEPVGKTAGRPSGLLGGGLAAFIGGCGYLYLTERAGMRYSYAVFMALFVGGFVLGLILELLVYVATGSRRHAND